MTDAVLFDMDGVITDTARAHAAAWKRMFDEFLERRARDRREDWRPFDPVHDYRAFVDGMPREEGVTRFLASRGITLPPGASDDGPDAETVWSLGERKNRYFRDWLAEHAVTPFPAAVRLLDTLRHAGVKVAVFSASRNAHMVLHRAGVADRFDAAVTGEEAVTLQLPGKPDPAMLVEAAARLGVPPERIAVIEDAAAGIEAAVRGGFGQIIGVDRTGDGTALTRAGAHIVVHSLGEIAWSPPRGLAVKTLSNLPRFNEHQDTIGRRLAGQQMAVFLDYDGTLTPIVEDHTQAFLADEMRAAVAALAARCPVAIVSGRDESAVRRLVAVDSVYYAGSHGFEIRGPDGWNQRLEQGAEFIPELDEAERIIRDRLEPIAGHAVERKRFAVAVHYRRAAASDVSRIESAVDDVLAEHPGLRKGRGKKVLRIQPGIDWDKGHAVRWLLEKLALDRPGVLPVYVGDDITDEDAFRVLAGQGLSLVVQDQEDRQTAADYALSDSEEVRRFLRFLAAES